MANVTMLTTTTKATAETETTEKPSSRAPGGGCAPRHSGCAGRLSRSRSVYAAGRSRARTCCFGDLLLGLVSLYINQARFLLLLLNLCDAGPDRAAPLSVAPAAAPRPRGGHGTRLGTVETATVMEEEEEEEENEEEIEASSWAQALV
ncbi:Hypothetical Protein FCC1311_005812 [Hondaea fermentalgiana]|uniref:Uncharacterized protein n=1 Tax=Hondaea fermentalgiana TaxID=2315210 RepID=A0A2R5GWF5_9STRA|nr:Hypothetical Protein FCC1311_005812 [Hondaea fermentalgiana]|eukprot:GBG32993.1 Hypothetical Protein FCC1311_005812 [Hondaea fermentalgiana]